MPRTGPAALISTAITTALALVGGGLVTLAAPLTASAAPTLRTVKVVGSLTNPWDLAWVGPVMLFDQRSGGMWSKRDGAVAKRISMALPPIFAQGESGMLGIVADPAAATNGFFYTCMAVANPNKTAKDVEVWKWKLNTEVKATKVKVLIDEIPLTSGRHSGCRLRFRSAHMLYVGTGDAAVGTNPQNLQSLGGKILRVRDDGSIPTSNPFYSRGGNARYVFNYGHRNVQGLIKRPGKSELWSVEHGPDRDDEINLVWSGRNFGWSPTPGYNEKRSMTDTTRFPSANGPKWKSGSPTVATSGGTFISGSKWNTWNGKLAVAMLKGQGIKLFTISSANKIVGETTVYRNFGRIRTVQQGPDGAVYFTTSNGSNDGIYKISAL
ncbi:MAG: PQQ-dependent sugar dehydrogenase [Propionibacteriaceae bacterium]